MGCSSKQPPLGEDIAAAYEHCDYATLMRLIMELADRANPYGENAQPWVPWPRSSSHW
ncbi:MAG: hypothetical protein R3C56_34630 [Pirellulaceae bacterium]